MNERLRALQHKLTCHVARVLSRMPAAFACRLTRSVLAGLHLMYTPSHLLQSVFDKYLKRELLHLRLLQHPHIVQFREVFATPRCAPAATHMYSCSCGSRARLSAAVCPSGFPVASSSSASACYQHITPLQCSHVGIVMEYAGGGTLRKYIETSVRQPPGTPTWWLRQACFLWCMVLQPLAPCGSWC